VRYASWRNSARHGRAQSCSAKAWRIGDIILGDDDIFGDGVNVTGGSSRRRNAAVSAEASEAMRRHLASSRTRYRRLAERTAERV
jgi:hypothetical protein